MRQIRIRHLLAVLILSVSAAGQGTTGAAPQDNLYANPGKLVSANGTRLNLYCMGSGSPTVVFESGWETGRPPGRSCSLGLRSGRAHAAMIARGPPAKTVRQAL